MFSYHLGGSLPTDRMLIWRQTISLCRIPWRSLACTQIRKAWPPPACHLSSCGRVLPWLKSPHGPLEDLLTICSEHKHKKSSSCASISKAAQPSPTEDMKLQHIWGPFNSKTKPAQYLPRQRESASDIEILPKILQDWLKSQWKKQTSQNSLQKLINRFDTNIEARIREFSTIFLKNTLIKHVFP